MWGRLEEKVSVITGRGGSIGSAVAPTFAREGASVVGCDLSGRPGGVASVALFLASDESSYVTEVEDVVDVG